jgi:FlaA1/EpsC-like NDP-sugar epimerase
MNFFENKVVLVTGSCGTVGEELVTQLLNVDSYNIKRIIGIDNNESQLFFQIQRFCEDDRAIFFVCDIKDETDLIHHMQGVDIVFHCAALKHVILNEYSPNQTVNTNIFGIQNIIKAANYNKVKRVIFTSSDKAVNPTNVMGTSKLMGERLITAANNHQSQSETIFASTRFGNVLGSNGSVVQIFHEQIKKGGPLTITDKDMSRFVMSVKQAANLVISSAVQARGGEVFITKMPVLKISDLAKAMIKGLVLKYGLLEDQIEIKYIGAKPGEKLYEELMSNEEMHRAIELSEYFSVLPAFRGIYSEISYDYAGIITDRVNDPYVSATQKVLSVDEIVNLLKSYNLLD